MTVGRLLALLAAAAGVLTSVLRPGSDHAPPGRAAPAPVVVTKAVGPPPAPATLSAGAVSRRFVVAYVALLYGRLAPAGLPDLSPTLLRQIAALHPNPAPAVLGAADPRLRSLSVAPARPDRARAVAVIVDRAAVYDVVIELRRGRQGWTITGLRETS